MGVTACEVHISLCLLASPKEATCSVVIRQSCWQEGCIIWAKRRWVQLIVIARLRSYLYLISWATATTPPYEEEWAWDGCEHVWGTQQRGLVEERFCCHLARGGLGAAEWWEKSEMMKVVCTDGSGLENKWSNSVSFMAAVLGALGRMWAEQWVACSFFFFFLNLFYPLCFWQRCRASRQWMERM